MVGPIHVLLVSVKVACTSSRICHLSSFVSEGEVSHVSAGPVVDRAILDSAVFSCFL